MKKTGYLFIVIFLLSACSNDDDSEQINLFTYKDVRYETVYAQGSVEETGDFNLYLNTNSLHDVSVSYVLFNFQNEENWQNGTYTFNNDNETIGTFFGEVGINYLYADETFGEYSPIVSGTVTLLKIEGDEYEVNYEVNLENGETVIGIYLGEID